MPQVVVRYNPSVVNTERAAGREFLFIDLKAAIRKAGIEALSVMEWPLGGGDFSIYFVEKGPHDEMESAVEITIPIHHFDERLSKGSDEMARLIGEAVNYVLTHHFGDVSCWVAVLLMEYGYWTNRASNLTT